VRPAGPPALAALTAVVAGCAAPAGAAAHSVVRVVRGEIDYLSADATSLNTLTVRVRGTEVELRDPTVDGGIDFGSCRPGETDGDGFVIQVFCPLAGVRALRVDLGEREDTLDADVPLVVQALGGPGADRLLGGGADDAFTGGDGDDVLDGRGGRDTLIGGLGADRLTGGDGDDDLRSRDGVRDVLDCGAGADRADADTADDLPPAAACEEALRTETAPPPGAGAAGDAVPPSVRAVATRAQRLRTGAVRVRATTSEAGRLAASGWLETAGVRTPLRARRRTVAAGGGRAVLVLRLSATQRAAARRALRRGRRVVARVEVVATDLAGNSAAARAVRVRLH